MPQRNRGFDRAHIARILRLSLFVTLLAGCNGDVGIPPAKNGGHPPSMLTFVIPKKLIDPHEKKIDWLFFDSGKAWRRKVHIQIDGHTVYRNLIPSPPRHPRIQGTSTCLVQGRHTLYVEDLLTKEHIKTNFVSGATQRIEIRFEPLSLGVYEKADWFYAYMGKESLEKPISRTKGPGI